MNGTAFLVLELVEGEDLAERLRRGPLPMQDALDIAKQIAEALEAAHDRGVIHRDLKPANVKVTAAGTAKVLDFGLAKAWAGEGASGLLSGDPALSPTLASSGTVAGMILGTAGYMSPEQMRGRPVDRRTDVWAFGVVLFELLTGRPLFAGETITDLIAAVVTTEPDWSRLPPDTPAAVRRLLRRCLQRDPRLRLPDIGSARLELAELLAGVAEPETGVTVTAPQRHRTPCSASRPGVCMGAGGAPRRDRHGPILRRPPVHGATTRAATAPREPADAARPATRPVRAAPDVAGWTPRRDCQPARGSAEHDMDTSPRLTGVRAAGGKRGKRAGAVLVS